MGDSYRALIDDLRLACAMEDCPLALTVEDLAAEVPPGLEWTKEILVRDALEVARLCDPVACCAQPFLDRLSDLRVARV